jgi:vacuolar-type H+-ATPase subunit D/Vma8
VIAVATSAAAVGKWVFTAPTREDYVEVKRDTESVKTDHAVLKAKVDGLRDDVSDMKNGQKAFQTEIKADISRLLDRRR